jgi:hypothetical protein
MRKWIERAAFWLVTLSAFIADARPGGGGSYSGGSHSSSSSSYHGSSSSGGSGDGGGFIAFVMLFILVAILIQYVNNQKSWDSNSPEALRTGGGPRLGSILGTDPDFSLLAFEDFVFELYSAAHRAASDPTRFAALAPYILPIAGAHLAYRSKHVEQVIIGSLHVEGIDATSLPITGDVATTTPSSPPIRHRISVRLEANLATLSGTSAVVEHWMLTRAIGAKSRAPSRTHTWPCPSCGAPWSAKEDPRTCAHCGEATSGGRFDWAVEQIWLDSTQSVGPTLTGTVAEQGTSSPTIFDPTRAADFTALNAADPQVWWDALVARITMIYGRLNEAWNALDMASARGLVTRSMLDYLRYWTDEYKRQKLVNRNDDAKVTSIELCKVRRDRYFDAITVRVHAEGRDYTLDASGKTVGGSQGFVRKYTEYWTFLRSSARRGAITVSPSCPNCGAPLAISDAGECTHCKVEVESGSFDWVLSKIEQDEVYRG